ncbi:uncharacterized protein BCR38DRAFT_482216 [Pseudomassariella vexata]|uniref:Uncharacterized protein n=1 Tax=Pseudomassariella vexata TaxID=1141098 RepID=A0A1Y2EAZ1_9PEZI|nr:uncharacterized protein BCR38DRAFT_482216 [Pseudomassariella vexata]ORY68731.1 hypothetical protein BCR38DRAFT_482216 [Pseudomassariella vexata]
MASESQASNNPLEIPNMGEIIIAPPSTLKAGSTFRIVGHIDESIVPLGDGLKAWLLLMNPLETSEAQESLKLTVATAETTARGECKPPLSSFMAESKAYWVSRDPSREMNIPIGWYVAFDNLKINQPGKYSFFIRLLQFVPSAEPGDVLPSLCLDLCNITVTDHEDAKEQTIDSNFHPLLTELDELH